MTPTCTPAFPPKPAATPPRRHAACSPRQNCKAFSIRPNTGKPGTLGGNIDIDDEGGSVPPTAAEALEQKVAEARAMVQTDPKAVANIIKNWTGANAGG